MIDPILFALCLFNLQVPTAKAKPEVAANVQKISSLPTVEPAASDAPRKNVKPQASNPLNLRESVGIGELNCIESSRLRPIRSESKAIFEFSAQVPELLNAFHEAKVKEDLKTFGTITTESKSSVRVLSPLEEQLVTVLASGASVASVLDILVEQSKTNIILASATDAKVTIRLTKVKLADALSHLCAVTGLTYIRKDKTYIVGDEARLKAAYPEEWEAHNPTKVENNEPAPEKVSIKSLVINYVAADALANSLKALFDKEGLIVSVGPAPTSPDLADRDTSSGTGVTAGSISTEQRTGRMLIFRGPESVVAMAIELAKDMDKKRSQVNIAVTISDVTDEGMRELGVDYTIGGTTITEIDPKGIMFGSFTRTPLGITTAIKALETKDLAKILASTNLSVLDQEKAFILIGNKINLPRLERYDQQGAPVYTATEYKAGIYLQVAPSISDDGSITLTLYPQVSTIAGFNEVNGARYPNIATREAQTTLTLKSGENIVIGGLMRNDELESYSKVPFLGDIPVIGELFKRRRTTKQASQVIISLTPVLVKESK